MAGLPATLARTLPGAAAKKAGAGGAPHPSAHSADPSPSSPAPSPTSSSASLATAAAANAGAVALWIALSAAVILYNKWILAVHGFAFPISLTAGHMAASTVLATALVRSGAVASPTIPRPTYWRAIAPIGALFAGTLWLGNAAYLHLSVSFIQMLKALMPVAVYSVGCVSGLEVFKPSTALNMAVITAGVALASAGELAFSSIGVALQLSSVCTEAARLSLVQVLLQRRGLSLNPVTTLYHVAPASLIALAGPWAALEARPLIAGVRDGTVPLNPGVLLSNAAAAVALNLAVFLLIGRTSALTMNVAGVLKDWLLIGLSASLFGAPISALNLGGYGIALVGVCVYNFSRLRAMAAAAAAAGGNGGSGGAGSASASPAKAGVGSVVALSSSAGGGGAPPAADPETARLLGDGGKKGGPPSPLRPSSAGSGLIAAVVRRVGGGGGNGA
jgi:hypothetical protein